jgi:hypothetical protein
LPPNEIITGQGWTTADWARVVSSAAIALASLFWNVWSKFIYPKPKLRTTFYVGKLYQEGMEYSPFLMLSATNYGPGQITLHTAVCRWRDRWPWSRWKHGIMQPLAEFPEDMEHTEVFGGGCRRRWKSASNLVCVAA